MQDDRLKQQVHLQLKMRYVQARVPGIQAQVVPHNTQKQLEAQSHSATLCLKSSILAHWKAQPGSDLVNQSSNGTGDIQGDICYEIYIQHFSLGYWDLRIRD